MKDLLTIHDFLFEIEDVGDWEGAEEQVADLINAVYHAVWDRIPADLSVDDINQLMQMLWDELRGSEIILEVDELDLTDWAMAYCRAYVDRIRADQQADLDNDDDEFEEEYIE